jgi:hypothetical protein
VKVMVTMRMVVAAAACRLAWVAALAVEQRQWWLLLRVSWAS